MPAGRTSGIRSGLHRISSTATGAPLDLRRSFTLDDDPPEDIGHFLAEAGFLHLAGVFTEAEMAAVSAELDAAVAAAERDDGASWWARTEAGEWYAARILGFNQRSPTLRQLLHSDRFGSIAIVHRRLLSCNGIRTSVTRPRDC